ncbi:MAG: hypothetical protein LBF28_00945 [Rickettsiales bacterium]|jgi:hypothetical protein|nr:hypothetical protein [Rickettsiales bacterium]
MSFLKNTIGFIAVLAVVPAAFGASSRISVIGAASTRMPTVTAQIAAAATSTSATTALATQECIEAYTGCLKAGDICGQNFEECTNKTLFFSKKALCASALMQCNAAGVTSLFGSATQTAFATKNTAGEYTYPTDGSVLGQMIEAAQISNRYDTSACVKRYASCLKKDDVCGADFELCTSNTEFKKQKLFCESTLARCQDDGKTELFGTTSTAANPTASSRIGIMISEGAALAAVNAVSTCYKVADQCILNACSQNPYKCKEGSLTDISALVDALNSSEETASLADKLTSIIDSITKNDVSGFLKKSCLDTIGANKFCYATFLGNGAMPTNSQLQDEDNRGEIYAEAYSSRMNDSMKAKIDELIEKFDKKTKQRCQDTIVSCAMRSCGGGSGLACYNAAASGSSYDNASIDITRAKDSIKSGCEAIINGDTYCKYSAATFAAATGTLSFLNTSVFEKLFTAPSNTETSRDPIGAVAALNYKLSTSFSPTMMAEKTKQCQNTAKSCVKSLCGNDYENCYRNRTDVLSSITNSGSASFDKSMNKVGGVLDRTIITGLCMETVKNNSICEELLKAKSYSAQNNAVSDGGAVWGSASSVRGGWMNIGATGVTETSGTTWTAAANTICTVDGGVVDSELPATMACGSEMSYKDADGNDQTAKYNTAATETTDSEYAINLSATEIFQSAVNDLEMEAQAKYNAKLTKQQNMCLSGNNGGIIGIKDLGGTFQWVKLKSNKVPKSYATAGLKTNEFVSSNEIYGSFCRIRITLQSDDKNIQDAIASGKDWSTAYFAAGDSFTCGSWIPQSALEEISNKVGSAARAESERGNSRTLGWMTALGTVVGGVGGGIATNALQKGGLGGLLGTTNKTDNSNHYSTQCQKFAGEAKSYAADAADAAKAAAESALEIAKKVKTFEENEETLYKLDKSVPNATNLGNFSNYKVQVDRKMSNLIEYCKSAPNLAKSDKSKTKTNLIGAGIGAVAGGVLGYTITKSVQDAKAESAEAKAKEEWMNEVGGHIRCYIGSDEVGEYSDIISTEME